MFSESTCSVVQYIVKFNVHSQPMRWTLLATLFCVLATWKDISIENNLQVQIKECHLNIDTVPSKLRNNIYTIAKRNVEGQDMLYQSLKLTNGIWILAELRIQPGKPNYTVLLKWRPPEVS